MSEEAVYINGIFVREKTFDNGGSSLNVGMKVETLIEELGKYQDDKGYVNFVIAKRRSPSEKGITHYVKLNTWKPKEEDKRVSSDPMPDDDVPF